jgi:hypothetical protein
MLDEGESVMKRRSLNESWQALDSVTEAAERFVNHTPRLKRLETERQALLDAIRRAQLLLSVRRLPVGTESGPPLSSMSQMRHQRARSSRRA